MNSWKQHIYNTVSILEKHVFSVFIITGLIIKLLGGVWPLCAVLEAPTTSFSPSFSGLGIARNATSSIAPEGVYVVVGVEPPTLEFDYYFSFNVNGTYSFIFVFPFYIKSVSYISEPMSINATNEGSVIWLSDHLTTNTSGLFTTDQHISGFFYIERTFETGSRGSYTFTLPFGMGINRQVWSDQWEKLQVGLVQENITLNVALPFDYLVTETFPTVSAGPEHWTSPAKQTFQTLVWGFNGVPTDVTIRVEDQVEMEYYATLPFISGIFLGIGSSVMITAVYDGLKERHIRKGGETD